MKQPPGNKSQEAISLREAAAFFAKNPPVIDDVDSLGAKANRELLEAAIAYAVVAEREIRLKERADRCRKIKLTKEQLRVLTMFPENGGILYSALHEHTGVSVSDFDKLLDVGFVDMDGRGRNVSVHVTTDGMVKLALSRGLTTKTIVTDGGLEIRIL